MSDFRERLVAQMMTWAEPSEGMDNTWIPKFAQRMALACCNEWGHDWAPWSQYAGGWRRPGSEHHLDGARCRRCHLLNNESDKMHQG